MGGLIDVDELEVVVLANNMLLAKIAVKLTKNTG